MNTISSGKLLQHILDNERKGEYLGKTVQMIPHFTNVIKDFICYNPNNCDYIICEIGGCVGDIEAMAFYEALRQPLKNKFKK
jgi:CTP synthase